MITARTLTTRIQCANDADIVGNGSAPLLTSWGSQYRHIGIVTDINVSDGEVVGTLVFNNDNVGKEAQAMYERNPQDPILSHSAFGVNLIFR